MEEQDKQPKCKYFIEATNQDPKSTLQRFFFKNTRKFFENMDPNMWRLWQGIYGFIRVKIPISQEFQQLNLPITCPP